MAIPRPSRSRTRLAVLVLASVTLVTVGLRDAPVVRDVREAASTVVGPVEGAADGITAPFRNAWHGITDYEELRDENERLRQQLAGQEDSEAGEIRRSDAEEQLAQLSAALDLPYAADVPTVAARVVSGPRSNFSHAVEIDKGTDDGVAVGMPVVTAAGLVGRISQASGSRSTVQLLIDPDFRVGVRLADRPELGTARGRGRGEPLTADTAIDLDVEIPEGTGLVTSGVDRSAYPPGIPVGEVTGTREGSGGLALDLIIEPLADIENLSYVSVMRWQPAE
ncbi:MAG TPA: rod shape-determining protein MreC [Acidimicrobiales bacterium]